MKVSNRVKRNISLTLSVIGCLCILSRAWSVMTNPSSGHAWFDLVGMIIISYLCFDNYLIYRRRVKDGIIFGAK